MLRLALARGLAAMESRLGQIWGPTGSSSPGRGSQPFGLCSPSTSRLGHGQAPVATSRGLGRLPEVPVPDQIWAGWELSSRMDDRGQGCVAAIFRSCLVFPPSSARSCC